jgi:hypothetical protein
VDLLFGASRVLHVTAVLVAAVLVAAVLMFRPAADAYFRGARPTAR